MSILESKQAIYLIKCMTISELGARPTTQITLNKSSSMSSQNYLCELADILQGTNDTIINNLISIYSYVTSCISPYDKELRVSHCPKISFPHCINVSSSLLRCEILPNRDSFGLTSPFWKVNNSKRISLTIKSFMESALTALNYFPPKL